jgi:hypothetical protein
VIGALRVPLRGAGVCLAAAGLLIAPSAAHPTILGDRSVAAVVRATGGWVPMHLAFMAAAALSIVGLAGVVALHDDDLGRVGRAGYGAFVVGVVLTIGAMATEAALFPTVARRAPDVIAFDGPVLGNLAVRAIGGLWVLFPVGMVVIGLAAFRAGVQRSAGLALALSAGAWTAFEFPFVPYLGPLATFAWSAALVWWAAVLWRAAPSAPA